MSSKRCKVVAQRKFAQGAVIPSSLLSNVDSVCVPAAAQKDTGKEPVSIFKSVTVDNFVTFLCFQDTLAHHPLLNKPPAKKKRPIVLINKCDLPQKRVTTKCKPTSQKKLKDVSRHRPIENKIRKKIVGMSLRNRTLATNSKVTNEQRLVPLKVIKKVLTKAVHGKTTRKIQRKKVVKPRIERMRKIISSSDFSSDDDAPLRCLRRKQQLPEKNMRQLRSVHSKVQEFSRKQKPKRVLRSSNINGAMMKPINQNKIIRKKMVIESATRAKVKMMLRSKAISNKESINHACPTHNTSVDKNIRSPKKRREQSSSSVCHGNDDKNLKTKQPAEASNESGVKEKKIETKVETSKFTVSPKNKSSFKQVEKSAADKGELKCHEISAIKHENKIQKNNIHSKLVETPNKKAKQVADSKNQKDVLKAIGSSVKNKECFVKPNDQVKSNILKSLGTQQEKISISKIPKKTRSFPVTSHQSVDVVKISENSIVKQESLPVSIPTLGKIDNSQNKAAIPIPPKGQQPLILMQDIQTVPKPTNMEIPSISKITTIENKRDEIENSSQKEDTLEKRVTNEKLNLTQYKLREKSFCEPDKSSFVEKWLDESSHYKADNSFTKEFNLSDPNITELRTIKRPSLLNSFKNSKRLKTIMNRSISADEVILNKTVTPNSQEHQNKCNVNFNVNCSCGECSSCQRIAKLQENLKRSIEPLLALDMTCSGINSTSKLGNTPVETICKVDMFEPSKKAVSKSSIYEFNIESDASPPVQNMGFRQSLRQKRISLQEDVQSTSNDVSNNAEEHLFYVDISPNVNNKAIEGRLVNSSLGKYIRCKLIPRSEMKPEHQIKVSSWKEFGSAKFMEEVFQTVCSNTAANKTVNFENEGTVSGKKVALKDIKVKPTQNRANTSESKVNVSAPSSQPSIAEFPRSNGNAKLVEAPVFRPSELEYQDPLEYIEKITPIASKFGLCKIIPPNSFTPECQLADDIRFTAYNQYVHRMLHRWGPSTIEMCSIKKHLETQNVFFKRPPLLGGIEADLPQIYKTVLSMGGLSEVMEKKKWNKVAEEMRLPKSAQLASKLDEIYMRHLLTYTTLSEEERLKVFEEVELEWLNKYKRMLKRAKHPLADQQKILSGCLLSSSESDFECEALEETEDCVAKGRSTTLSAFYKTATNAMHMWFSSPAENPEIIPTPTPDEVETQYWKYIEERNKHICVNAASIDSGIKGYGFPNVKLKSNINRHPWNLKVLTNNSRSILRSLGRLMGVTVPTIHVGMVFTTGCWYRDPHNLPWIEYHHSGAPKIWYGIPDEQSENFRKALQKLVPSYCQNKTIWLPSDMTMVPPSMLTENGVSLCRTVQNPGEYIVVFPRSFTSSICTGYVLTESVYFAPLSWLKTVYQTFQDIKNSCEPTIFSLEHLLIAIATDSRPNQEVLLQAYKNLKIVVDLEQMHRDTVKNHGIKSELTSKRGKGVPMTEECYICRSILYLSKVVDLVGQGTSICLEHAVEALNSSKSYKGRTPLLIYTHTNEELRDIVRKLESRLITRK